MSFTFGRSTQSLISGLIFLGVFVSGSAAETYPHVQGLVADARELRIAGNFAGAEGKLARAQRIAPRSADVYLEYAYLRKDQGDYQDLKNVVSVGADVSDGPPQSLTQLRILRKNLSALALPVTPSENFSTPPAKAGESIVAEVRPPRQVANFESSAVATQAKPIESVAKASEPTNRNLVAAESAVKPIPREKISQGRAVKNAIDPGSQVQGTTQEIAGVGTNSGRDEIKPLTTPPPADELTNNVQRTVQVDKPKLFTTESSLSERGEMVVGAETEKVSGQILQAEKKLVGDSKGRDAKSQPVVMKTSFVGLGILARPQSGTWMSRGPVETDY